MKIGGRILLTQPTPLDSPVPAIAVDSTSTIYVVWYDDTPGNAEIYYKNGK